MLHSKKRHRSASQDVCTSPLPMQQSGPSTSSLAPCSDLLVPFNVSGTLVLVGLSTLMRDPLSLLFRWATMYAVQCHRRIDMDDSCTAMQPSLRALSSSDSVMRVRTPSAADSEDDAANDSSSLTSSSSMDAESLGTNRDIADAAPFVLVPFDRRRHGSPSGAYPVGIFIDCDLNVFRLLVRLLQGYLHAIPEVLHAACALEAKRLGLTETWRQRYPPGPTYAFRGGGVSHGGLVCTSYIVLSRISSFIRLAGASMHEPADRWTHAVTVCVDLSEFVGVGVVSNHVTDYGADCRGVEGTAMYYNSGDIYWTPFAQMGGALHRRTDALSGDATLPSSQTPTAGRPSIGTVGGSCSRLRSAAYGPDAAIRIVLDVARGTVLWERCDTGLSATPIVQLWCPHADGSRSRSVAFAVVCSGKSTVRLEA